MYWSLCSPVWVCACDYGIPVNFSYIITLHSLAVCFLFWSLVLKIQILSHILLMLLFFFIRGFDPKGKTSRDEVTFIAFVHREEERIEAKNLKKMSLSKCVRCVFLLKWNNFIYFHIWPYTNRRNNKYGVNVVWLCALVCENKEWERQHTHTAMERERENEVCTRITDVYNSRVRIYFILSSRDRMKKQKTNTKKKRNKEEKEVATVAITTTITAERMKNRSNEQRTNIGDTWLFGQDDNYTCKTNDQLWIGHMDGGRARARARAWTNSTEPNQTNQISRKTIRSTYITIIYCMKIYLKISIFFFFLFASELSCMAFRLCYFYFSFYLCLDERVSEWVSEWHIHKVCWLATLLSAVLGANRRAAFHCIDFFVHSSSSSFSFWFCVCSFSAFRFRSTFLFVSL